MVEEAAGGVPQDQEVRANTYSLLAAFLSAPPTCELLAVLGQIETPVEVPINGRGNGLGTTWQVLKLAADRADLEALDSEYHDLFIGIGRGELVPYGSWYTTGFLMDRPLAVLRGDLAELGFERQDDVKEPEDHAAALLEIMGFMISAGDVDIDAQRRFFTRHIGPWMPAFFLDMQKTPAARFYKAVGQFGEHFVEFENKYLSMVV